MVMADLSCAVELATQREAGQAALAEQCLPGHLRDQWSLGLLDALVQRCFGVSRQHRYALLGDDGAVVELRGGHMDGAASLGDACG